jgi:hypothetical protein
MEDIGRLCITVDLRRPINELLNDFKRVVAVAKCKSFGKHPIPGCKATCENSATCGYEGEAGAEKIVKQILAKEHVAFDPDRPQPRAIGIWLWDYRDAHACSIAEAISSLRATQGNMLNLLGYAESEDHVFRSFYRHTATCIAACEVLSFK